MNAYAPSARQRGATLVVVLVLLLVMTLLALLSMRGTLLQERMSANAYDRSLAFQAAEAALRYGEAVAATRPATTPGTCSAGVCGMPEPDDAPVWEDEAVWSAAPQLPVGTGSGQYDTKGVPAQYIVELLADDIPSTGCVGSIDLSVAACGDLESRYRITARSQADGRATVVLQTTYAVK